MNSQIRLIVNEAARSPEAEAFRILRTNIQFCKKDNALKKIMFTSAIHGEGKSVIAANTAVALAQTGKKVIILDCDLRNPVQHRIFDKVNQGIANVLVDGLPVMSFVQETEVENLKILTSGVIPPNQSELLGSDKMQAVFHELVDNFDYVIVDAPPVLAFADALVLASNLDGIILVLNAGIIGAELAEKAKKLLLQARGELLGAILNRTEF
jgi:capsular exopolysaccharide synthesis family protein